MANKTALFKTAFNQYMYGNTGDTTLLVKRPYKWGMSIHEVVNNPNTATVDTTWWTNTSLRKSAVLIANWTPVSGNFKNGVRNTNEISFDYVPTGQSWTIRHYILWAIRDNNGVDVFNPIITGSFATDIVLNELQILSIQPNNLVISEQ
jgi:hypothetical protein